MIRRRYGRSIRNLLDLYIPLVSGWKVYDNSQRASPRLVAEGLRGEGEFIYDPETWSRIRSVAHG